MRTGRPKEYVNRLTVTTNMEQDLYDLGKDHFEINACEALTDGYIGKIDSIINVTNNIEPVLLDYYLSIRNRIVKDRVSEFRDKQRQLKQVAAFSGEVNDAIHNASLTEAERRQEVEKLRAEKLLVYDKGDDTRKTITREQYQNDPDCYTILPKREEVSD